jgi:hypothetical protein
MTMGLRGFKISRKSPLDEQAFLSCSPESDYWCGIMATDGCVGLYGSALTPMIQYGTIDIEHVYKFRAFVKSEHAVVLLDRKGKWGRCKAVQIGFRNRTIGEFLISHGITPKKSLTLKVSERLAASPHFWRGAVDGDGTVAISKRYAQPQVFLTSSSFSFIMQFSEFCASLGLRPKISANKDRCYSVGFGSQQAIKLLSVLYADATVWLDRKKLKVDQIFAQPVRHKYSQYVADKEGVRVGASVVQ